MLFNKVFRIRVVGFSFVGGMVFLIGLAMLTFLVEEVNVNKIVAGIITTIASVELNFLLNKYLNWGDRDGKFTQHWLKFHLARLSTIAFGQIFYILFVSIGVHYLVVSTIGVIVVSIANYVGNDRFVFRR